MSYENINQALNNAFENKENTPEKFNALIQALIECLKDNSNNVIGATAQLAQSAYLKNPTEILEPLENALTENLNSRPNRLVPFLRSYAPEDPETSVVMKSILSLAIRKENLMKIIMDILFPNHINNSSLASLLCCFNFSCSFYEFFYPMLMSYLIQRKPNSLSYYFMKNHSTPENSFTLNALLTPPPSDFFLNQYAHDVENYETKDAGGGAAADDLPNTQNILTPLEIMAMSDKSQSMMQELVNGCKDNAKLIDSVIDKLKSKPRQALVVLDKLLEAIPEKDYDKKMIEPLEKLKGFCVDNNHIGDLSHKIARYCEEKIQNLKPERKFGM